MKSLRSLNPIKALLLTFIIIVTSCVTATKDVKRAPEYAGIDERAYRLVDEWYSLAELKGIEFEHNITVGFKEINRGRVVGTCTYGDDFREIDIDLSYWQFASNMEKRTLIFHELTHCACTRGHDYGDKKEYYDGNMGFAMDYSANFLFTDSMLGFFEDNCPLSIMYPYVIYDGCTKAHQEHYDEEMFDRCTPW